MGLNGVEVILQRAKECNEIANDYFSYESNKAHLLSLLTDVKGFPVTFDDMYIHLNFREWLGSFVYKVCFEAKVEVAEDSGLAFALDFVSYKSEYTYEGYKEDTGRHLFILKGYLPFLDKTCVLEVNSIGIDRDKNDRVQEFITDESVITLKEIVDGRTLVKKVK